MSKNTLPSTIHYKIPLQGLKFSTNKIYAGIHWTKRKEIKDNILDIAGWFCRPVTAIQAYPVQIFYRFVFKTRALDTLNTAAMAKMFEDAFRSLGIIKDDSPKFVKRSILEVVDKSKEEDYVEVEITSITN